METRTIEPKAVTYHVTKFVYPNMNGEITNNQESQHLFPDARKGAFNQSGEMQNFRNANSYGIYGGQLTRPGPNGSSAGPGGKPYSSSGPYSSQQAPFMSSLSPPYLSTNDLGQLNGNLNGTGIVFPSLAPNINQTTELFRPKTSPSKQSAFYQNGVLTINRQ